MLASNILIKHFSLFSAKRLQYDELAVVMKKITGLARVNLSPKNCHSSNSLRKDILFKTYFFLVFAERADYEFSVCFQSSARRFIKEV